MIKVYTYVVGDLLHVNHLQALRYAKAMGDYLVVGVLTDEAVEKYKRRPVVPFIERYEMVASLRGMVDEVMVQHSADPTDNLKSRPDIDIVTHADDWGEDFLGSAYMRSVGKKAMTFPYTKTGPTTTGIINEVIRRHEEGTLP